MAKDEHIRFPPGSYQAVQEGITYKIDPENDAFETTQRLNLKYSPDSKEETINLVNKLGIQEIQKRVRLFSKLLLLSIFLFLFLIIYPLRFSEPPEDFLSIGKFLTVTSEIVFLYMFGYYGVKVKYYNDSHCKNCGQYFVFEEFQAPLMKEESRDDTYTKTLTKYWRCKNCGYEDIIVELQPINHHREKKQHNLKDDTCEECGKKHAMEEYRDSDVLKHSIIKKIRYFKCRYCGYHEIRLQRKIKFIDKK
jgi:transcription elongation factor Elf1